MAVRKPLPGSEPGARRPHLGMRPRALGADVAYTAEQIQVLEGREHVRRRPSMYIGSTSTTGLHHLVYEVVDNAVDEALAGHAQRIVVTLFADGSVQVDDDGRGIPVDIHKKERLSALELVMTRLNAGGKFGGGGYKVSSGLHGVGVSAVNFLSEKMQVWVHRGGKVYHQEYARGVPKDAVKPVGKTDHTGTIVRFWPDPQIFPETKFDREVIQHRLREMAYLNKRLEIALADESLGTTTTFYFEGGIVAFVRALNRDKTVVNVPPFYVEREIEGTQAEVALQYNETFVENVVAFANTIHTIEGGSHVTGFRSALTNELNRYARKSGILKESDPNLTGEDVREGLTAVISVKVLEPEFEGQTKGKLGNAEVQGHVSTALTEGLTQYLEENPSEGRRIIEKSLTAMGAGIGDNFNIEKMRYHRIVSMTDADVDGSHIRTLLLTFFFRHFPEVIARGYLYMAQPPLYKVSKGKQVVWCRSEADRERALKQLGKNAE